MLDAIIIAGSLNTGLLRKCSNEACEAMIRIRAKPMIRYVVDALIESQNIKKIVVAGPIELKEVFPEDFIEVVEAKGTIIENTIKALDLVDNTKPVLVAACDIPLLSAKAINDFVKLSEDKGTDFFYPIVSMEEIYRRFTGVKRTFVKLKEGTFTGGNLFIINPAAVRRSADKAQEFINYRKSPLQLCRLLGFKFVIKLLFSNLSIPELEKKVSEVLGIKAKAVITLFPEIGIDVDKPSDYLIVSAHLGKPA